jgi:hypothetical protein
MSTIRGIEIVRVLERSFWDRGVWRVHESVSRGSGVSIETAKMPIEILRLLPTQ